MGTAEVYSDTLFLFFFFFFFFCFFFFKRKLFELWMIERRDGDFIECRVNVGFLHPKECKALSMCFNVILCFGIMFRVNMRLVMPMMTL